MRISEEEFQRRFPNQVVKTGTSVTPLECNQVCVEGQRKIKTRPRHQPGKMNKTEKKYADFLELRKKAGEIVRWVFEPFKLRFADNTFYSPDFMVVTAEQIESHEYKGHWEDDARVKIKVAAEMFPELQFIAARTDETGSYKFEYFR
jgi:hypothetical protein